MSPLDEVVLRKRLAVLKAELSKEYSLPKGERSARNIASITGSINTINGWLVPKVEKKVVVAAPAKMNKTEFRENYKKEFAIAEPDKIMVIDDLEMLEKVWPTIVGKNVQISAPAVVKDAIARKIKEARRKQRVNGFR